MLRPVRPSLVLFRDREDIGPGERVRDLGMSVREVLLDFANQLLAGLAPAAPAAFTGVRRAHGSLLGRRLSAMG
jgi:hypothetical protein